MKTRNHLTFDERVTIQELLNKSIAFKIIAKSLGKSATTVSREVKRHLSVVKSSVVKKDGNGNRESLLTSKSSTTTTK